MPGKGHDGYWTAANLIDQVKNKAMPIFKVLHPNSDALFLFDNSQNHRCLPPDGLRASLLNLSDGGKNVQKQRAGKFKSGGVDIDQPMQHANGIQKGGANYSNGERALEPNPETSRSTEIVIRTAGLCVTEKLAAGNDRD